MLTITPGRRASRCRFSIMFRRSGEEDWLAGKVVNLSESGVLFGPTELRPGTHGRGAAVAARAGGRLRHGQAGLRGRSRAGLGRGVTAVRFDECRFLLE